MSRVSNLLSIRKRMASVVWVGGARVIWLWCISTYTLSKKSIQSVCDWSPIALKLFLSWAWLFLSALGWSGWFNMWNIAKAKQHQSWNSLLSPKWSPFVPSLFNHSNYRISLPLINPYFLSALSSNMCLKGCSWSISCIFDPDIKCPSSFPLNMLNYRS